jgi:hypothetical protein
MHTLKCVWDLREAEVPSFLLPVVLLLMECSGCSHIIQLYTAIDRPLPAIGALQHDRPSPCGTHVDSLVISAGYDWVSGVNVK